MLGRTEALGMSKPEYQRLPQVVDRIQSCFHGAAVDRCIGLAEVGFHQGRFDGRARRSGPPVF